MKVFAIAVTDLRRLLRWRANIFFLFVLPMLIILLLGAAFGSGSSDIGVVGGSDGPLARHFVADLGARPSTRLHAYATLSDLRQAVARGRVDAGVVIPSDFDARLEQGRPVRLAYLGRPDSAAQQLRSTIQSVVASQSSTLAAAQFLGRRERLAFPAALARAQAAAAAAPAVEATLTAPDGGAYKSRLGQFGSGASTQLLLFVFLNSLQGAVWVIETRRLGIARRMLSTPTSTWSIVGGQLLGRLAIAILQALIIVLGTTIFFGVNWGNPAGTAAVILSFSLVATGAAILVGSLFSNEQQAGPVALLLGLGLAALGGSMAPLEIFPSTARTIAHITPHAWANDAFSKLLAHGGDLINVLPQIAVLLGFAALAMSVAVWRLRHTLTT